MPTLDRPITSDLNLDFETAWRAVLDRDVRFDGRFVYAVTTTGVFCRPTCPSRRPHRKNVELYPTTDAARRQGYRACRRCRPAGDNGTSAAEAIELARRHLDEHRDQVVTLATLGKVAGMSPAHLQRTFKRMIGVSPHAYQRSLRLAAFRADRDSAGTVRAAMDRAGFGSSRALYERSKRDLGMTPGAYRRGGAGVRLAYATRAGVPVPGGGSAAMLVATTEHGVCAVLLGVSEREVIDALSREFPRASRVEDEAALATITAAVAAFLGGDAPSIPATLDMQGTPFQRVVWSALQRIPAGETRSYAEIAAEVGRPTAARAVAGACAANRVAFAVPCHRVCRGDGRLGGYKWGVKLKAALLSREARAGDAGQVEKAVSRMPRKQA